MGHFIDFGYNFRNYLNFDYQLNFADDNYFNCYFQY